ncbi:unnamed protein product [Schistocephalus solidus]|uniref:Calmodulin n=1 Tax=Schistocephalus solidus TaxID=70667 RepID=A0A183SJ64_SCHSO|nr:unnamed protein product [Schistocephalus solidus]
MRELREIFDCFDADGNGSISKEEFTKILNLVSQKYSPVQLTLIMSKVDINGDGQIGFDEFVEAFSSEQLTGPPDALTLKQTFDIFDRESWHSTAESINRHIDLPAAYQALREQINGADEGHARQR